MTPLACASCDNQQAQLALKCAPVVICYLQKLLPSKVAPRGASHAAITKQHGGLSDNLILARIHRLLMTAPSQVHMSPLSNSAARTA